MKRDTVLIVGNAGYVGGFLTTLLVNNGWDVYGYDSLLYETRYLKFLDKTNFHFISGDVRDTARLKSLIKDTKPDWIIWLSAIVGDGACKNQPALAKEINANSVKWLCENYDGKICFPSTCSVYGKNNDILSEDSPVNPLSIYAETKYEAEQYLLKNHPKSLIFRLGTLHSISDDHSRIRLDLCVNIMTLKAFTGHPIDVYGKTQYRPMCHVRDVGHAMSYFMEAIDGGENLYGLYNLSQHNYTIMELAEKIASIVPNTKIVTRDIPFQDERNYKVDCYRVWKAGWKPEYSLSDGIKSLVKVFKESRIKNVNEPIYYNEQHLKDKEV